MFNQFYFIRIWDPNRYYSSGQSGIEARKVYSTFPKALWTGASPSDVVYCNT